MKTTKSVREWLMVCIVMAPLLYYLYLWQSLPEIIPIHFDARGNPNNYGSRQFVAFLLLFINLGMYLLLRFIPKIDPKNNFIIFNRTYTKLRWILAIFFTALGFVIINSVIEGKSNTSMLFLLIAMFISVMGNYMSNIRPNYFIGIRTPWTLENAMNWKKTHAFAGKLWFFSGIAIGISVIFLPGVVKFGVFMGGVMVLSAFPFVYSYLFYRKSQKQQLLQSVDETSDAFEGENDSGESRNWFGPFYVNPKDPRIFVPKRILGTGWTLNFGHFVAYLLILGLALLIFTLTTILK